MFASLPQGVLIIEVRCWGYSTALGSKVQIRYQVLILTNLDLIPSRLYNIGLKCCSIAFLVLTLHHYIGSSNIVST